jgi:hypothetical protein
MEVIFVDPTNVKKACATVDVSGRLRFVQLDEQSYLRHN